MRLPLVLPADFGKEEAVSIENLGKADIDKRLQQLVQKGESMPRQVQCRHVFGNNVGSWPWRPGPERRTTQIVVQECGHLCIYWMG